MRHAVTALLFLAASTLPASASEPRSGGITLHGAEDGHAPCKIELGPRDRLAQDADLVIPAGADVGSAIALRGSVVVQRGARVKKAVAAGGSVRVEAGAQVTEDAIAISGDVRVDRDGRVGGDVISLGGRVRIAEGATVGGSVVGLSLQLAGLDLERELREKIGAEGKCLVEKE
jgi:UDP-3-O-[3-hydroxymyristoyl] glucosamine N-acyltransferase